MFPFWSVLGWRDESQVETDPMYGFPDSLPTEHLAGFTISPGLQPARTAPLCKSASEEMQPHKCTVWQLERRLDFSPHSPSQLGALVREQRAQP